MYNELLDPGESGSFWPIIQPRLQQWATAFVGQPHVATIWEIPPSPARTRAAVSYQVAEMAVKTTLRRMCTGKPLAINPTQSQVDRGLTSNMVSSLTALVEDLVTERLSLIAQQLADAAGAYTQDPEDVVGPVLAIVGA